jgi:apolipoprotein N-acyltransferase
MSAAGFGRLICYEQLLPWPMLRWAVEKPTILIAVSNEAWTGNP